MKPSIGKKLTAGFSIILIGTLIVSSIAYMALLEINHRADTLHTLSSRMQKADRLREKITESLFMNTRYLLGETEKESELKDIDTEITKLTKELEKMDFQKYQLFLISKFKKHYEQFKLASEEFIDQKNLKKENFTSLDRQKLMAQVEKRSSLALEKIETLNVNLSEKFEHAGIEAHRIRKKATIVLIVSSFLIFIASIVIAHTIIKSIKKPIGVLIDVTSGLARGDLSKRLDMDWKDEFGDLAKMFNQMASELEQFTNTLFENEEKTRSIIESSLDAVISIDSNSKITTWNKQAEKIFGYMKSEAYGNDLAQLIIPPALREAHTQGLKKFLETGENNVLNKRIELTAVHKEGHEIPIEIAIQPIPLDDSYSFNAFVRDLTDQKKLETEKQKIESQLLQSQKLESIGQLAGGIAHDFNNLLGGILGYASLLKSKLKDDKKITSKLEIIEKSAQRGAQLTQALLGFAKRGHYETSQLDMNQVVEETISMIARSIPKTITVKFDKGPITDTVKGDSTQIVQILMNLGINARDAMPNGGELTFKTEAVEMDNSEAQKYQGLRAGKYIRVSVIDNGTGIPKEIQAKIFDPFFTTKEVGKGSGLGLSMIYGIMQNHQGAIELDSEEAKGTSFHLIFPTQAEDHLIEEKPQAMDQTGDFSLNELNQSVLIVDDEAIMRDLAKDILEPKGAKIYTAQDGKQAIEIYKQHSNEIKSIIMDVTMPEMDGVTAYQEIRKLDNSVKVIFASGYTESNEISELQKSGDVDFIQKPFKEAHLLKKLALSD